MTPFPSSPGVASHAPAAAEPIVRVMGLSKRFPVQRTWREMILSPRGGARTLVVDDVSFDVCEGQIFGLLGQNGAGKTTIFKMLSTMIVPDDGTASIAGCDVMADAREARAVLAPVMANERSLNWRLSARENIRLFSVLQGLRGREARAEEARVLAIVGLADAGEKLVGAYSSGMRQRLMIARALLGRPRVLLLDEPTRSLDPISARDFRQFLLQTVVRQERCTVLLATHDADEVWELCDRVGVLDRGRLLEVDATSVLRHRAGNDRYRTWIRSSGTASVLSRMLGAGLKPLRQGPAAEPEWEECEFEVPGGTEGAAHAMAVLLAGSEGIARFEKASPTLADLIEAVLAARATRGAPHA